MCNVVVCCFRFFPFIEGLSSFYLMYISLMYSFFFLHHVHIYTTPSSTISLSLSLSLVSNNAVYTRLRRSDRATR